MKSLTKEEVQGLATPFYLFDATHLRTQINKIKSAFEKYWGNYEIAYSVKTNSLPALGKEILQNGLMAEVVSKDEYELAVAIGFSPERIVSNGPIKDSDWLGSVIRHHSFLNVDSKSEIRYLCEYASSHPLEKIEIGLRINNYMEDVFPGASTAGKVGSRFGFSLETGELERIIKELKLHSNISISGLHLHTSTNLRSLDVYRYIVSKFCQIVADYHLCDIRYFDIGGGFYGEVPGKPGWEEYIATISSSLKENGYTPEVLKLLIEPGVSLLAGCFSYYTRVVEVKDTPRIRFVLLDGTRLHVDPFLHKTIKSYFYHIDPALRDVRSILSSQALVGNTCLEYDSFFTLSDKDELKVGDIVRFDKVGAYTITLSPLFITWFPPVWQIDEKGIREVRIRWTTEDFLRKSILV